MGVAAPALNIGGSILGLAGAGVSAFGAFQEGKAASDAAAFRAQVARQAASETLRRGDIRARDALERGKIEEIRLRQEASRLEGRQRAVLAGHGVQVDVGTGADIVADTAATTEFDVLNIRSQAEREALAARLDAEDRATQLATTAALETSAASNATRAGILGATSSLLGGVGTVAQKWYSFNKEA